MITDGKEGVPAYVGFKSCGCAVATIVDDDKSPHWKREVAKAVADWVRDGLTVERKTVGWVRRNLKLCECARQRQLVLPE